MTPSTISKQITEISRQHCQVAPNLLLFQVGTPIDTDRLRKAGKPHNVIITAVARTLVTIANALCKSRQKWAAPTS